MPYDRVYYLSHKVEARDAMRRWRAKNPERSKENSRKAMQKKRSARPEENKQIQNRAKRKYNSNGCWTEDMVKQTALEQGGKCMICRQLPKPRTSKNTSGGLCADHDHASNEPRGLLCAICNLALGGFKDSPELCESAAEYLRSWQ